MTPKSSRWSYAEAPARIAELVEWGTHFDQVNGHVACSVWKGVTPMPGSFMPWAMRQDGRSCGL